MNQRLLWSGFIVGMVPGLGLGLHVGALGSETLLGIVLGPGVGIPMVSIYLFFQCQGYHLDADRGDAESWVQGSQGSVCVLEHLF